MMDIKITRRLNGPDGLFDLDFETQIQSGTLTTIYGPSGAGKTSVLRMLAGLLRPDAGHINADGVVWYSSKERISLKPQHRSVGMVFQEYSLFPNMTVRENLEFALDKGQAKSLINEMIEVTELGNLQHLKPTFLSGGQKQRVALVRALVRKPVLLLLDEPLSALDSEMQSRLQDYILQVQQQHQLTTLLISHDMAEVVKMSKRVLVLENGKINKDGPPERVLSLPIVGS